MENQALITTAHADDACTPQQPCDRCALAEFESAIDPAKPPTRTFPDVLNQWTDELLKLNQSATLEQIPLILHLGLLGQRLVYEAYDMGAESVLGKLEGRLNNVERPS